MSLAAQQEAFLRLTTSLADQDTFFADPQATGTAWGLSAEMIAHLQSREAEIRRFGRSLYNKRRHEIAHLLPATRRALGNTFAEWFTRYCRECPGAGQQPREREAREFAAFLAKHAKLPAARYDAAALQMRNSSQRVAICWMGGIRWVMWWRTSSGVVRHWALGRMGTP